MLSLQASCVCFDRERYERMCEIYNVQLQLYLSPTCGNCKQNDPVKSAAPSMEARLETKRGCRLDVGQEVASKEQLSFQRGVRERWC